MRIARNLPVSRGAGLLTGADMFLNSPVNNIFDGILVDAAVATKGTGMERVSYNITLLGKIAFTQMIIT
jgi:hypothetical protein